MGGLTVTTSHRRTPPRALLEIFYSLAKRDAIKRCVEKKTVDIYLLFIRQAENARHEFDENRRHPPLRANEPQFAGSALWAKSLASMVQDSWFLIQDAKYLVHSREAEEAAHHYDALMGVLNDFKTTRYLAWVEALTALDSTNLQARMRRRRRRRRLVVVVAVVVGTVATVFIH